MDDDPEVPPDLYAWVGIPDSGGKPGIKQFSWPNRPEERCAAVSTDRQQACRPFFLEGFAEHAAHSGRSIRLVRYIAVEVLEELEP